MAKFLWAFFFVLSLTITAAAQHQLKGKVMDEQNLPLSFATVALLNPTDSILKFFGVTNKEGVFQIKNIKEGSYLLQYSYVGMQSSYESISIPRTEGEMLEDKILEATALEEVIVEAELIPVKFKKDTLEFDAKAFQTRPGDTAEELLRKLPGVEVDQEGNIKAEGEEVVKVLVDGKEFFDKDPKVATKNLPAKALDKVQVINRKSLEAVFTGVDDGIREKTINLQLKEDHKKGYFGLLSGGVGTDETYQLDANYYRFTEKTQNAIMGMYNNINRFGFTNKDNVNYGQRNRGINEALAGGLNLSYNPKDENRYYLSYLGNRRVKNLEEQVNSQNFFTAGIYQQIQDIEQKEIDQPHSINYGIIHSFSKQNRFTLNGDLNWSNSDLIGSDQTLSSLEEKAINQLFSNTEQLSSTLNFNLRTSYIIKFKEDKTQLKLEADGRYNEGDSQLDWENNYLFFDPLDELFLEQFRDNNEKEQTWNFNTSFLQKFDESWSLSLEAKLGSNDRTLVRREGVLETASVEELDLPDFRTRQNLIRPALTINRNKGKTKLNLNLGTVHNQFDKILDGDGVEETTYHAFLPSLNFRYEYRKRGYFNINYNTEFNFPSLLELYPVVNARNPLAISRGNLQLDPEYRHNLAISWSFFDQFSFTTLFARVGSNYTRNKVQWGQSITNDLVKVSSPINVDYDYGVDGSFYFSRPIRSLEIISNISIYNSWNRGLIFINTQENINTQHSHTFKLTLENRKKEVITAQVAGAVTYTDSRFSIAKEQDNIFFNTNYNGNIRVTPNDKWMFYADLNVVNYNQRSFGETLVVPLLSANISYFFRGKEKSALSLRAFDLLNQYQGIERISEANFLLQREWNTLTRYVMLSFQWRFRKN